MTVRAPQTTDRPRRAPSIRVRSGARDLLISGAVAVGLWLTVAPGPIGRGWQLVLAAACVVAVLLRDRFPVATTVVATASTVAAWTVGATADPCVLAGWCLFAVAERRGTRLFPWWLLTGAALVGLVMLVLGGDHSQSGLRATAVSAVVLGAAWALGTRTRQARRESAARARAEERLRLAREVHDVLSHSLGTIGVQAGIAAHVTAVDADRLRTTLRDIESDARASLVELRALLRAEREDAENTPGATVDETIRGLAQSLARAGIRAEIVLGDHLDALSLVHRQTIRRIVQEAVTNVIRHSGASSCRIAVESADGGVRVTVSDDGHGTGGRHREGLGLTGLRERAVLLGGRLELRGDVPGFTLAAWLPVDGGEPA